MWYFDRTANFYYAGVEIDYDNSGCIDNCEDICRCSKIINARVESVDIGSIVNEITKPSRKKGRASKSPGDIYKYAIERLLVAEKAYDSEFWYIETSGGYYGEEIGKVSPENITDINTKLSLLYGCSNDSDLIRFVLKAEYGYILPVLKTLKFSLEKVDRKRIKIPNTTYHSKLDAESVSMYKDYDGPIAVVREEGDNLILIDGYHRYIASDGKRRVGVIVGR